MIKSTALSLTTKELPLDVLLTWHLHTCTYFTFTFIVALVTLTWNLQNQLFEVQWLL